MHGLIVDYNKWLASRMEAVRCVKGISLENAAKTICVSPDALLLYEKGKLIFPAVYILFLCNFYRIEDAKIFSRSVSMEDLEKL